MKKVLYFGLVLCTLCLSACGIGGEKGENQPTTATETPVATATPAPSVSLPIEGEMRLTFQRDMGNSYTDLIIHPDGTFRGIFFNENAGESGVAAEGTEFAGWEYEGTEYLCIFSGTFKNIEKKNEYTYALELADLETEEPAGKEWIDDGQFAVRYVAVAPPGMENGDTLLLYTPKAPIKELPESFLYSWPGKENETMKTEGVLGMYGVYNEKTGQGYFKAE